MRNNLKIINTIFQKYLKDTLKKFMMKKYKKYKKLNISMIMNKIKSYLGGMKIESKELLIIKKIFQIIYN
jgi:hypothetical protein